MSLTETFPQGYSPNELQQKILPKIESAIKKKKKFIILSAPTGFGKSFVPPSLANFAPECSPLYKELCLSYKAFEKTIEGGYKYEDVCMAEPWFGGMVLTVTKPLQDQYYKQFKPKCSILKGKNNYTCAVDDRCSVDTAPCILTNSLKKKCWSENKCFYYKARNYACSEQFTTLNYAMYFHLPDHVKRRKFLVCDEASELENELVNNFTISVDYKRFKRLGITVPKAPKTMENRSAWLTDMSMEVEEAMTKILNELREGASEAKKSEYMSKYSQLQTISGDISSVLELWGNVEFIFEDIKVKDEDVTTITPLHVDYISHKLFDHAEHVILMSATIIDPANFAKRLGITDYEYIEAPSPFDPKKSPIFFNTDFSLNYKNIDQLTPKIVEMIKQICEHHKDEKGLIHTHSLALTNKLADKLTSDRFLFRSDTMTNADILTQHYESDEPTVMGTPSMTHGTDLKGKYCTFMIIVKAPFAPLTNERVKRLYAIDKQWYIDQMISTFIQACGRGTRSEEDECTVYVIDGTLARVIKENSHILPKHFTKRVV